MSLPHRRFSTGLRFLDQRIDGGIPIQTLLALTASASSQSELLLDHITETRACLFVSTTCADPSEIQSRNQNPTEESHYAVEFASPGSILDDPDVVTSKIEPESYVVIDDVTALENGERTSYLEFLNALKTRLHETDSIGLLHCLDTVDSPALRSLTLKRSDHVWQLQTTLLSNEIRNQLYITKSRGYRALNEPIPVILSDQVQIDTTRNI